MPRYEQYVSAGSNHPNNSPSVIIILLTIVVELFGASTELLQLNFMFPEPPDEFNNTTHHQSEEPQRSLCRYKLPGQAACQGFNVRFDSGMCELYRFQSVYFAQQFGCVYHALKPVNRKGIVVTPVYPYQQLLNKPPPPKNKPTPTFTFLVQIKLKPDSTAFNKSWSQFKVGFSDPSLSVSSSNTSDNNDSGVKDKMSVRFCGTTSWDAYWIGNELLYQLTNKYTCSLHVYLSVNDSGREELYYSHYDRMVVGGQTVNYQLITLNYFGGNLSTATGLSSREGRYFSTYDDDNDPDSNVNCALAYAAEHDVQRSNHLITSAIYQISQYQVPKNKSVQRSDDVDSIDENDVTDVDDVTDFPSFDPYPDEADSNDDVETLLILLLFTGREELYYSHYDRMVVGGQTVNYQLITLNYFGGNLSTATGLSSREGRYFSTYDDDNDPDSNVNCALAYAAEHDVQRSNHLITSAIYQISQYQVPKNKSVQS
ncbi:hypothetical protein HELRODRAFT_172409 [Helobdella robusta]|uniref:Fibrinogen C-terminal domain-containing protein n=1 Tax=Helobdella robusta TaxID=6412 RepID=T1F5A3_HELRO|nr:hypothetical protein HELRODRAFT_172409 [Helobdella robusta]ESO04733.1 hypothetical protein HELRODRAFT_172409 [Helobdella robusta]